MPWKDAERNKADVARRRRKVKALLVAEAGGRCVDCGEEFPPYVLDFDHRDPITKEFGISSGGLTKGIATLRLEAAKCDLVCANCHRIRTHKQRCSGCELCVNYILECQLIRQVAKLLTSSFRFESGHSSA